MLRRGGEGYLEGVCEKGNEQREGTDEASATGLGLHGGAMQAIAGGAAAEWTENAFLQEEFKAERARLEGRLAEIWREKKRMDALLAGLEENEQEYIRLRFEKGYGIDYIGRRLYISRATVFRMQDRILEKLRQAEIETP